MAVDEYKFKVKKKITDKVIKEAARRSNNIKKEAREFFNITTPKEIEELIKTEKSYWHAENGYMYTDDSVMQLLSLYPYLENRGYITKPLEVRRGRRW